MAQFYFEPLHHSNLGISNLLEERTMTILSFNMEVLDKSLLDACTRSVQSMRMLSKRLPTPCCLPMKKYILVQSRAYTFQKKQRASTRTDRLPLLVCKPCQENKTTTVSV